MAQATFAATLVDEWIVGGVTDAVVCPGSRSTPLALALARRPEVRLHVRLDERSAAFFALGLGLATGRPAVVVVTSGTAAAELHAAVVEAHESRVPLVVCTADRPPELHDVGAPQTIDQVRLYGTAPRWFADPGVAEAATAHTWRPLAARVLAEAREGPLGPGPVHLNLAFREPLVAEPGPLPPRRGGSRAEARHSGPAGRGRVVGEWAGSRGIVVAGAGCGAAAGLSRLAERLGWPILADPRSGLRRLDAGVVAAADAILRDPSTRRRLLPEVVLLLGSPWASKVVGGFVAEAAAAGAEVVAVDPWWRWADPDRAVTLRLHDDPAGWVDEALGAPAGPGAPPEWCRRWLEAERAAQEAIEKVLWAEEARGGPLSEPALARTLFSSLPADSTLVVASSMPVRDLEWFAAPRAEPPRVLANRGANGIDGVTSTVLGVAAAGPGPVVGLLGDLAFLHDVSALVRLDGDPAVGTACLVVVDNRGGAIFNFLPQASAVAADRFELLFGTPPVTDLGAVARGFGLEVTDVGSSGELAGALHAVVDRPGLRLVRAHVGDRRANVALHDQLHEAVRVAVCEALG